MEATVTPLIRPVRPRVGRAVHDPSQAHEVFGWPCAVVLALEDGKRAYLLDFEHATQAPSQLRFPVDRSVLESWLSGEAARVIVQSIFGKLIIVGVDWGGGFEPDGAYGMANAA